MPPSTTPVRRRSPRWVAGGLAILLSAVMVVALVPGACGSTTSSSPDGEDPTVLSTTTTVVGTTSLDEVTVEGAAGAKPTVTFTPSFVGTESTSKLIQAGDGPPVVAGQRLTVDYLAVSGSDGTELNGTFGAPPEQLIMGSPDLQPIITTALVDQPVGSRVLVAVDPAPADSEWVLLVFDIKAAETIPTSASGEPVEPAPGLPAVTVEDGVPTVAKPEGDPPSQLVVQPLINGSGPPVAAGQTVTMNYTGVIWASGTVFQTSWTSSPVDFPIGAGQVIEGFEEGLIGQPVGSRVMLVIPPDKGYGADGNPQVGITSTDTLVFLIDLLAAA